jgi:flagellar biosynthesis component FlhA
MQITKLLKDVKAEKISIKEATKIINHLIQTVPAIDIPVKIDKDVIRLIKKSITPVTKNTKEIKKFSKDEEDKINNVCINALPKESKLYYAETLKSLDTAE